MNRISSVILVNSLGKEQVFSISHAERLLKMPNSGWQIKDTQKFQFDNDNESIRVRTDKRTHASPQEEGANK